MPLPSRVSPPWAVLYMIEGERADEVASETVHFSSRAELLVSKLGRSSKLSPRFLMVVSHPI